MDKSIAPDILPLETEGAGQGTGCRVLLNGNCDRMDMKVLGLANHSKISNDYLN